MSSDLRLELALTRDSAGLSPEPPSASAVPVGAGLCGYFAASAKISSVRGRGERSISGSGNSTGERVNRRSCGLTIRNRSTLIAPDRLNIETAKNVAADVTFL